MYQKETVSQEFGKFKKNKVQILREWEIEINIRYALNNIYVQIGFTTS